MSFIRATTLFNHGPTHFLSRLTNLHQVYRDHVLMYALSSNAPDIESLFVRISSLWPQSVGCLSAALPQAQVSRSPTFSCSLAFFPKASSVTFRSTLEGQQPIKVGRRHVSRRVEDDFAFAENFDSSVSVDWNELWEKKPTPRSLPPELDTLSDVKLALYFSDSSHQGLSSMLQSRYPSASQLGLISTSTPFVTGQPFTLFRNGDIYSNGAVGLALTGVQSPTSRIEHHSLVPMGSPMLLTKVEGNLIHRLDDLNPSRRLLNVMEEAGFLGSEMKDVNLFIGIMVHENGIDSSPEIMYRVISGDPSKGTMAVEPEATLAEGMVVQFYCDSVVGSKLSASVETAFERARLHSSSNHGESASPTFRLMVNPAMQLDSFPQSDEESIAIENTFIVSSENGFLISSPRTPQASIYQCTIPGALGLLHWR